MMTNGKKLNIAILLDDYDISRTFHPNDIQFLKTFAEITTEGKTPDRVDEEFIRKFLVGVDACITGWSTPMLKKHLLGEASTLRLIAHAAGTPKAIVTADLMESGIRVFTVAPVIAIDVAESALGGIIYWLKCMRKFDAMMRSGVWIDNPDEIVRQKYHMHRLNYRLSVGIIGASHVGKNLIKFLKPFGVKIKLYDPYVSQFKANELGVELVTLEELMHTCDVVSNHAPNIPDTYHLIDKEKLALMKDGALFVNTARGVIVDEQALIAELQSGRLCAYLDVFEKEPLSKESPLLKLDNVLLTPHISGGHTVEGGFERGNYIVQQLYSYHTTGLLQDETIKDMLDKMA